MTYFTRVSQSKYHTVTFNYMYGSNYTVVTFSTKSEIIFSRWFRSQICRAFSCCCVRCVASASSPPPA